MNKDFDKWNSEKKRLELKEIKIYFKEEEVWWCSLGLNIKSESCGKGEHFRRPVLVFRKLSHTTFIGIPLTSVEKQGTWFTEINLQKDKSYAILSQIKALDINRMQRRIGTLDTKDFLKIKSKLKTLLKL